MNRYRFQPPPRALRRARLDNVVLVPASELPQKAKWQALANQQPAGTTLIVLPNEDSPQRRTLEAVASRLRAKGQSVRTVPVEGVASA